MHTGVAVAEDVSTILKLDLPSNLATVASGWFERHIDILL